MSDYEDLMAILGRIKFAPMTPEQEAEHKAKEAAALARQAEEREARDREWRERRWASLVPPKYRDAHNPEALKARVARVSISGRQLLPADAVRAIVRHEGPVVLTGIAGSGKTSLAVAALRQVFEDTYSDRGRELVGYATASSLGTARIQHPAGQGEAPLVDRAMGVDLLLLDDLGNERQTQTNATPDVILQRYEDDLRTWVTTGETSQQLAAKYGAGVARRVFERALVVQCGQTEEHTSQRARWTK